MHGRAHARLVVRVHVVVAALKRVVAQGCGGGLAIHVANQLLLLLLLIIERPFVVVRYGCNVVVVLVCHEGDDPAEHGTVSRPLVYHMNTEFLRRAKLSSLRMHAR